MSDEPEPRAETGAMQFGDDWPGVFIRGDNAMFYATVIERALETADPFCRIYLQSLYDVLVSCRVPTQSEVQMLKAFPIVFYCVESGSGEKNAK